MRKRLFEIIEISTDDDKLSRLYDFFMIIAIILSIIPLTFKEETYTMYIIDMGTAVVFTFDYCARLITADYKVKKGWKSFIVYPFSWLAIIDLLSLLPSLSLLGKGFKLLKLFRLFRSLRVLRVFRAFRYSKNIRIIISVFHKQRDSLLVVCWLAVGYVMLTALVIFNAEPDTFNSFFDAIYWATISLTTVGYGDIFAVSTVGKIITMVSALFGVAIVALPAGIITAGYMEELHKSE